MRSYISAAWSAENRRQVRSIQLYRWLDGLQTLALDLAHETDPYLTEQIREEGLSVATIERHMKEDCFPALLLWNLLQIRISIEQTHATDVGAAFSRFMDLIASRMVLNDDEISRRLRDYFSKGTVQGAVVTLDTARSP
ncbi:MAG: hypothetical protein HQ511_02085 [Rhodospirillales bacterium]|nr:hypothetical protein [Rhodospirillales bacterium]